MAGWGDDPVLAELRTLVYEEGWRPVAVTDSTDGDSVEVEGPGGERRTFASDHIAFHRFVEGLGEDFDL
ncbi:hypothetical protein PO878_18440 [Iamia majanohamensis]|uniref:Uncharacterized protein n=1 Tax=Iamia majanohamensis TaxID=467976 RepID=A0AAE9Y6H8_9ACTN|nr:hypothetical protein [Iamia majanohamensis]WCO66481.1 hypothetical protein PO878_18440 [Iamia majanohamensis]